MVKVTKNAFDLENDSLLLSYETISERTLDDAVARIQRAYANTIIVDKTAYSVVIKNREEDIAHLWVLIKLN